MLGRAWVHKGWLGLVFGVYQPIHSQVSADVLVAWLVAPCSKLPTELVVYKQRIVSQADGNGYVWHSWRIEAISKAKIYPAALASRCSV